MEHFKWFATHGRPHTVQSEVALLAAAREGNRRTQQLFVARNDIELSEADLAMALNGLARWQAGRVWSEAGFLLRAGGGLSDQLLREPASPASWLHFVVECRLRMVIGFCKLLIGCSKYCSGCRRRLIHWMTTVLYEMTNRLY